MAGRSRTERIVITGLGVLCALGDRPEVVYERMQRGESGIKPVTRFRTDDLVSSIAGELDAGHLQTVLEDESTAGMDWCARYAAYAARQALEDSGLTIRGAGGRTADRFEAKEAGEWQAVTADRIGLVLGTCNGGILSLEKQWTVQALDREHTANYPFYQQGDDAARALGLGGPVATINTACSASGNAIGYAADLIRWGYADAMLAGGSDPLSHSVYAGFNVLRALSPEPTSPFAPRYGLNLGEGAAFVVLETLERALARGARIYGELVAYGLSNDAHHETAPHPEGSGLARAVRMAMDAGGISGEQIDYINAHGTGTPANDRAEVAGLKQVFGDRCPPISSSKAYFGHNLGAAAAIELVTALYAVQRGYVPGTLRFDMPREGCEDVDVIGPGMRKLNPAYLMSNNAAFGGHNVSLIVRIEESWSGEAKEATAVSSRDRKKRVAIAGIGAAFRWGVCEGSILAASGGEESGQRARALADMAAGGTLAVRPEHAAFSLKQYAPSLDERRMEPLVQYTIGAVVRALRSAGIAEETAACVEIGFIYGTSRGSTHSIGKFLGSVFEKGPAYASSIHFPYTVINQVAGKTSEKLRLTGFGSSLSTGGSEGLAAAMYAAGKIRDGELDICVVGAGDERSPLTDAIDRAKGLDQSRYRPEEGCIAMTLMELGGRRRRTHLSSPSCAGSAHRPRRTGRRHWQERSAARCRMRGSAWARSMSCCCVRRAERRSWSSVRSPGLRTEAARHPRDRPRSCA